MLQRIINILYRHPKSSWKHVKRFGGFMDYQKMRIQKIRMKKMSERLDPVHSYENGLTIYFLTGEKYLFQTLFCITSLVRQTNQQFNFILIDDGSFTDKLVERVALQLPGSTVFREEHIQRILSEQLPIHRYPNLNKKREIYPHIKKITDIHSLPGHQWKLVLDSDMLFWSEPTALIDWLKSPDRPLHMIDCDDSYGYSHDLMSSLCGGIKSLINVGAIGLSSNILNWDLLEAWISTLEEKEGQSYYLEQALSAMIIGMSDSVVLNKEEYIVNPSTSATGILHHYVDLSKKIYFMEKWKHQI